MSNLYIFVTYKIFMSQHSSGKLLLYMCFYNSIFISLINTLSIFFFKSDMNIFYVKKTAIDVYLNFSIAPLIILNNCQETRVKEQFTGAESIRIRREALSAPKELGRRQ